MDKNISESPESIIKRLNELREWQEEQQRILIKKQDAQRKLLNNEQRKMYEILGLENLNQTDQENQSVSKDRMEELGVSLLETSFNESIKLYKTNSHNPLLQKSKNILVEEGDLCQSKDAGENIPIVIKKPFLKRGQGLTARFKVDPELLRLNNLPKYKYAGSHKKFFSLKSQKEKTEKLKSVPRERGGLRQTYNKKIELKLLPTNNVVPSKHSVKTLKTKPLETEINRSPEKPKHLDPSIDVDDIFKKWTDQYFAGKLKTTNTVPENKAANLDTSKPLSWAEVLDPNNIKPVTVNDLRKALSNMSETSESPSKINETDDLDIFELLEKKAEEGSSALDTSQINRWINNRRSNESNSTNNDPYLVSESMKKAHVNPRPSEIQKKIIIDQSDDDGDDDLSQDDEFINQRRVHVRFSDKVQINEVTSDTETSLSDTIEPMDLSKTSTPNTKTSFEKFKSQLFENNNTATINSDCDYDYIEEDDVTIMDDKKFIEEKKFEIIEKSEQLKERLEDLKNEIEQFQNNNRELIKLKQEHYLETVKLDQERIEMKEMLNDERIKLEIELHDERMKIEEDKKKYEKLLKDLKTPNRKEREEMTKLKEQVSSLQAELKSKDSKHLAAQTRLRTQFRNTEKECREKYLDNEHLRKQIKKLESDMAKISRQTNNKMLQEINKNIAKLAPQITPVATEVRNKNPKVVVAKVVSHKYDDKSHRILSKSVPNLCQDNYSCSSDHEQHVQSDGSHDEDEPINKFFDNFYKNAPKLRIPGEKLSKSQDTVINNSSSSKDSLKREIINSDGSKDIWYTNGNLKKISSDAMNIRMLYYNKDIKETNIHEGTVKYYYAETNTWHTTYLDGLEILEFPNGQTEHRYNDGLIEIHFPNGSIKMSNPTDQFKVEEWRYPDGTNVIQMKNGEKIISMPNGQREIHTEQHKRREYPDGTVKTVFPDGSQETRYSNGRIRLKDKQGILVMDSENVR